MKKYQFSKPDGRSCCQSDVKELLCPDCQAKASRVEAPNPYAAASGGFFDDVDTDTADVLAGMARFRRDVSNLMTTGRAATLSPAKSDVHLNPPDGYSLALQRRIGIALQGKIQ